MPIRAMRLRLESDKKQRDELQYVSRLCARFATWLMQRYRAADTMPPRLPDPLPVFKSGKKKGRVDWSRCVGEPPPAKLSRTLYAELRAAFPELASNLIDQLVRTVHQAYRQKRFDIAMGRIRTPEYRDLHPIPVRDGAGRLVSDTREGGYVLEAAIYSTKAKRATRITIPLWGSIEYLPTAQRAAIEQYADVGRMPRALIHFRGHRKRARWFVTIPYEMEITKPVLFDDRTLIVRRPPKGNGFLRCTYERPRKRPWTENLGWAEAWAAIDKTQAVRAAMQQKYGQAVSESGAVGHGRKRALECFTRQRDRTMNRQRTFNQTTARRIITIAERWRCGVIEYEDLGHIPKDAREGLVLGDWSYYQLKERLALLCTECSIVLQVVEPPEIIMESLGDRNEHEESQQKKTAIV